MGIFDFFRAKKKKSESEEEDIEMLEFPEVKPWLSKRLKKNNSDEEKAIILIKQTIEQFIKELKERILALQDVDVDEKKSQENYKEIVKSGREKYIELLEQLFQRLQNIQELKLKDFAERINKIFHDFDKTSYKNYERATILIGKEMAAIKDTLKEFSRELIKIFGEKKEIIELSGKLLKIQERLKEINSNQEDSERLLKEDSELDEKIKKQEQQSKDLNKKIEEIKKSKEYLENLSNKRKNKSLKEDLKREIMNLKQLVDFKAMARFFHINPRQLKIVQEYRDDFQASFEKDNGTAILELLNEAKLNNRKINEKSVEIQDKISDIKKVEKSLKKDETEEIKNQLENIEIDIENLNNEKEKIQALREKLQEDEEELMNSLKQELEEMNVELR